jgi:dTDP-4-dehydrorhamnose 3,5-epimerase-like enzyme
MVLLNAMKKAPEKEPVVSTPKLLADDERGIIEQLPVGESMSVLRITSKKGTVRANHYHQKDFHYCYLVYGKIRYVERKPKDASAPLQEWIITPGQIFYTRPLVLHAMEFLEDSEFYAFTPRSGKQDDYEEDVVRETLIDPKDAAARA